MAKTKQKTASSKLFSSTDMSLVAGIMCTGEARLVGVDQYSPNRWEFYLEPHDICQHLMADYLNNKLLVSAKALSDNIRGLRSYMH